MMDNKEETHDLLEDAEHLNSEAAPASLPEPRAARFGEGLEGAAARRERGVTGPRAGFFTRTSQYFNDVRAEMKRVSWPSGSDVKNTTIIVLIAVIFFAVYLLVVDKGVAFLITQLDNLLDYLIKWISGSR